MDTNRALEQLAQSYVRRGYEVDIRPGPERMPAFAQNFRVEIVGRRGSEGVIVSAKKNRKELAAHPEVSDYAELTGQQSGWRFDLAILEGDSPKQRAVGDAIEFSTAEIDESLVEADRIAGLGFTRAGVITAWAAFEAAMRLRLRAAGERPDWTLPREMITELYSTGLLTPSEFERLDTLAQFRNQVVHGFSPSATTLASESDSVRFLSDLTRRFVRESIPVKQTA